MIMVYEMNRDILYDAVNEVTLDHHVAEAEI